MSRHCRGACSASLWIDPRFAVSHRPATKRSLDVLRSARCLGAHAAVLVFLTAAARAGIVAADLCPGVADRFRLLALAPRVRHHLLVLRRHSPRSRLVDRRPDRPDRVLEATLLLHAEDTVRHLVVDALPHGL